MAALLLVLLLGKKRIALVRGNACALEKQEQKVAQAREAFPPKDQDQDQLGQVVDHAVKVQKLDARQDAVWLASKVGSSPLAVKPLGPLAVEG